MKLLLDTIGLQKSKVSRKLCVTGIVLLSTESTKPILKTKQLEEKAGKPKSRDRSSLPISVNSRNQWLRLTQQALPTTSHKVHKHADKKKHLEQPLLGKFFEKTKAQVKAKAKAKSKGKANSRNLGNSGSGASMPPVEVACTGLVDGPIVVDDASRCQEKSESTTLERAALDAHKGRCLDALPKTMRSKSFLLLILVWVYPDTLTTKPKRTMKRGLAMESSLPLTEYHLLSPPFATRLVALPRSSSWRKWILLYVLWFALNMDTVLTQNGDTHLLGVPVSMSKMSTRCLTTVARSS